jgi:hypothetical protein
MKHLILLPLFFTLTACPEPIKLNPPPPPAERLICDELPAKPDVLPLQAFAAENGAQVYFKADVDARDQKIAGYIVQVRGSYFSCYSNLGWVKDYYGAQ